MDGRQYIFRASAPDAIGIMADIATLAAHNHFNILKSSDFADVDTSRFYIWQTIEAPDEAGYYRFVGDMKTLATRRCIDWSIRNTTTKPRLLVMASKADHCVTDLLYRARRNKLGADIAAIVSNHETTRWHAEVNEIPFHHIPVSAETKISAERSMLKLVNDLEADFVVLARYMQVLSNDVSRTLEGRCINIHHSALPSFKGARPYEQAFQRGVKLIGATAHYVTPNLDEGPIIAQDCEPVDHLYSAQDLAEKGRDLEARVLSRAVTAHAEGRVFLNGRKTVVF
ncbi:MAG: formyltetrahydrofolate deformylase [Pacificimonas sp.]